MNNKKLRLAGHLIFGALFLMAGWLDLERMLYSDAAFYLFQFINKSSFVAESERYAGILYQLLPYCALKAHASVKTILILYSVNIILISYIGYIVSVHVMKNIVAGYTILFMNFVGISTMFFYPLCELQIGLICTAILYAWLDRDVGKKINNTFIAVSIFIIILGFFSHPAALPPLLFVVGFMIVYKKEWTNINYYTLLAAILLLAIIKSVMIKGNSYEAGILANFSLSEMLGNISRVYSIIFYFKKSLLIYLPAHAMFIILVLVLLQQKQWINVLYASGSYIGLLCFYFILYHKGESNVMMEKGFSPTILLLLIPFFTYVIFHDGTLVRWKSIFLLVIVVAGFGNILRASTFYRNRVNYIKELVLNTSAPKTILYFDQVKMEKLEVLWGIGVETLLMSSIINPDTAKTIYLIDRDQQLRTDIANPDLFLCVPFWQDWSTNSLNKEYFKLPSVAYVFRGSTEDGLETKTIACDAETVGFMGTGGTMFSNANTQSQEKAHSGLSCAKLTQQMPYGMTCEIKNMQADAHIKVSVWRYDNGNADAALVIAGQNSDIFYQTQSKQSKEENGWQLLELNAIIPETMNDQTIKIYCWNFHKTLPAYFDDLKITQGE